MDSNDNFKDVNPWHNLDFGTFSQGLAIGYDWFYDAWDAEQKERLQNAIVRLCFQVANESYAKKSVFKEVKHNLQKSKLGTGNMKGVEYVHNHNSFVNSGVIMAALALTDEYPANARQNDGELYYVNVDWLNAGEMRKTIYATVMKGDKKVSNTCRYSIESYVVSMRTDGSTKLDKLLDAMMRYGDSAAAYAKQN